MATVTVSDEYTDIFAPLGDVQQAVDEALKRYAVVRFAPGRKNTDAATRHSMPASPPMRIM